MATDATSGGGSGEENDCVPQKLDVEQEIFLLISGQLGVTWVEGDPRQQLIRRESDADAQIFERRHTF